MVELLQLVSSHSLLNPACMLIMNRVFLWGSLCYSCCMTGKKQGAIALSGDEESNLGTDNVSDEEYARRLQAEDPNWQA